MQHFPLVLSTSIVPVGSAYTYPKGCYPHKIAFWYKVMGDCSNSPGQCGELHWHQPNPQATLFCWSMTTLSLPETWKLYQNGKIWAKTDPKCYHPLMPLLPSPQWRSSVLVQAYRSNNGPQPHEGTCSWTKPLLAQGFSKVAMLLFKNCWANPIKINTSCQGDGRGWLMNTANERGGGGIRGIGLLNWQHIKCLFLPETARLANPTMGQ